MRGQNIMPPNNAAVEKLKRILIKIREDILTAGTDMEDGSVFAGVTPDGKQIYALPMDLGFTAAFNNAAKAVKKLNEKKALGHDDWQIPDLNALIVLQRNLDQASLKGTFKTTEKGIDGPSFSGWYWSSTERPDRSRNNMYCVRFPDGAQDWFHKDSIRRVSCLPVRLVAAAPAPSSARSMPLPP